MDSKRHSPSRSKVLSRQKRPLRVAQFLNRVPIEDRHAATNALLCLGLRAYKIMHSATPPDISTLQSSIFAEWPPVPNKYGELNGETAEENVADGQQLSTVSGIGVPVTLRQEREELPVLPPSVPMGSYPGGGAQEGELNVYTSKLRSPDHPPQGGQVLHSVGKVEVRSSGEDVKNKKPLNGFDNGRESHDTKGGQPEDHTRALDLVMDVALNGLFLSNAACYQGKGSSAHSPLLNLHTAPGGRQPNNENAPSLHVASGLNVDLELPLPDGDGGVYPVEFLNQLATHIRETRGVRENPILLAACMPQSLAVYTLQDSFMDLYRNLLVSYHISA